MGETIRNVLESADDPVNDEAPLDLDWQAFGERVDCLGHELSPILKTPFVVDDGAQDATFWGDMLIRGIRVCFSNFGSLFTFTKPDPAGICAPFEARIVQAASDAGFQYVSRDTLETPYTGRNPHFGRDIV